MSFEDHVRYSLLEPHEWEHQHDHAQEPVHLFIFNICLGALYYQNARGWVFYPAPVVTELGYDEWEMGIKPRDQHVHRLSRYYSKATQIEALLSTLGFATKDDEEEPQPIPQYFEPRWTKDGRFYPEVTEDKILVVREVHRNSEFNEPMLRFDGEEFSRVKVG